MASVDQAINKCLQKMHDVGGTEKGTYGEQAVFKICELIYQKQGGILYHSYSYKTSPKKCGNIKVGPQGNLMEETLGPLTEIDVLLVTPNKIFAIEVKAYKSKGITLYDDHIEGCFKTDKSPIHQNEMHCQHLYEAVFKSIPDGDSSYIIPICVFVDKCKIADKRSAWQRSYIYKATLDTLPEMLEQLDVPSERLLDLPAINRSLIDACIKYEKRLPLRFK